MAVEQKGSVAAPSSDHNPRFSRRRFLYLVGGIAAGVVMDHTLSPKSVQAEGIKTFDLAGTLHFDGVKSDRKGTVANSGDKNLASVDVLTQDLSGNRERVTVLVGWVRRDLAEITDLRQDSPVHFVVQDGEGFMRFRATRVIDVRGNGLDNPGLSTGGESVSQNRKHDRKR